MFIKEITVGGSRTINLGNYNSIRVEGSCTVSLDKNEQETAHLSLARNRALSEVKIQLIDAYERLKPPAKKEN